MNIFSHIVIFSLKYSLISAPVDPNKPGSEKMNALPELSTVYVNFTSL